MTAGNFDSELIERVVHEVVQRLTKHGVDVTPAAADTGGPELRLSEQVVALGTLEGRLDGVARVIVPPRAVVTPAAKDELRDKGIELVRG